MISLPAPGGPAVAGPVSEPDQIWLQASVKGAGIRAVEGRYANRYSPLAGELGMGAGLERVEVAFHSSWTSATAAIDSSEASPSNRLAGDAVLSLRSQSGTGPVVIEGGVSAGTVFGRVERLSYTDVSGTDCRFWWDDFQGCRDFEIEGGPRRTSGQVRVGPVVGMQFGGRVGGASAASFGFGVSAELSALYGEQTVQQWESASPYLSDAPREGLGFYVGPTLAVGPHADLSVRVGDATLVASVASTPVLSNVHQPVVSGQVGIRWDVRRGTPRPPPPPPPSWPDDPPTDIAAPPGAESDGNGQPSPPAAAAPSTAQPREGDDGAPESGAGEVAAPARLGVRRPGGR